MLNNIITKLKGMPLITRSIPLNESTGPLVVGLINKFIKLKNEEAQMVAVVITHLMQATEANNLKEFLDNKEVNQELTIISELFAEPVTIESAFTSKFNKESISRLANLESDEIENAVCSTCGAIL